MMYDGKEILKTHRKEYISMLTEEILPFWLDKTDNINGGFFTCYNVYGDQLISKDKYVWSQGRCVWIYSKLAENYTIPMEENMRERCRNLALEGSKFLEKYCILDDGQVVFLLGENNIPKKLSCSDSYAISTFADCFVAMGLAAAGSLGKNQKQVKKACEIFFRAAEMAEKGTFQTAPDILPKGWRGQAAYMILINTACEIGKSLEYFSMKKELEKAKQICAWAVNVELTYFVKDNILLECLTSDYKQLESRYGRHINPGHTAECMWFILEASQWIEMPEVRDIALNVIKNISSMAWDRTYGGMYYYLDRSGKMPQGEYLEEEEALASAMMRDWDDKMWWPHLETMYANMVGTLCYGDESCWEEYIKYREYTLKTFPNENKNIGEWIQIRNRKGEPLCEQVGGRLPVKDPYHLLRTMMLLIERISKYIM